MNDGKEGISNKMVVAWQRYYSGCMHSVSQFIGFLWL